MKHNQEQSEKSHDKVIECIICKRKSQNLLKYFNQGYICKQCYASQKGSYTHLKNGKLVVQGECNFIVDGIYLGDEDAAFEEETFQKFGISAVCVCGKQLITAFPQKIKYKKYLIQDYPNQNILDLFDQNYQWIKARKAQGKNVLIHCSAGVSRSPSFTIAYIMKQYRISYQKAFQLVKKNRKVIRPNFGFVKQLKEYQKILGLSFVNSTQKNECLQTQNVKI